jgi:hypothetical protein
MSAVCAALLALTYPGFRKIPTESNVFINQHKMLFPLKMVWKRVKAGAWRADICFFAGGLMKLVSGRR